MKKSLKIFLLAFLLIAFLVVIAWMSVRQLANIRAEFDRVAQVDLVLIDSATKIKELQFKKEIIFNKMSSASEELTFGQINFSRKQYLTDNIKSLREQLSQYSQQTSESIRRAMELPSCPVVALEAFRRMDVIAKNYDNILQKIFSDVEKGGFELSLEDLDNVDNQQRKLSEDVDLAIKTVWRNVQDSMGKSDRWQEQSQQMFWFTLWFTLSLVLLVFVFKRNLDEISHQKKELEKVNEEFDRFVHTVSHDIAGSLTAIVGYGAYLEGHYQNQLDPKGQECIGGMRKGSMRLNGLIKELLDATKKSRVKEHNKK